MGQIPFLIVAGYVIAICLIGGGLVLSFTTRREIPGRGFANDSDDSPVYGAIALVVGVLLGVVVGFCHYGIDTNRALNVAWTDAAAWQKTTGNTVTSINVRELHFTYTMHTQVCSNGTLVKITSGQFRLVGDTAICHIAEV